MAPVKLGQARHFEAKHSGWQLQQLGCRPVQ
jgi:hypothetical protein